eukprot:TRINITY_DN2551_c0_g1_i1.p1 TRINITY_DN2551_c0_g1~~TRINITY_DN2551_c0_g1_i1.p1  ORF type:complete len:434 (+),score=82.92 TRINITY_DN2551_c0_g1_i1:1278-2579(+)
MCPVLLKIAEDERRRQEEEAEAEQAKKQTPEQVIAKWGNLKSRIFVLSSEGDLSQLLQFVEDPKDTIVCLDFDQTITIKDSQNNKSIRGGKASIDALEKMHAAGCQLGVITAQPPSEITIRNLKFELTQLKLNHIFGLEEWNRQPVMELLKSWGSNEDLSLLQLSQKLATLIVLNTLRFGNDLARIGGSSRVTIAEDDSYVTYYLQQMEEPNPGSWSAKTTLKRKRKPDEPKPNSLGQVDKEEDYFDALTCPVLTWKEYMKRTKSMRGCTKQFEEEVDVPERLFLKLEPTGDDTPREAMTDIETMDLVRTVLQEANIAPKYIASSLRNPAKVIELENGVKLAKLYNTYCSKLNKSEAMEAFVKTEECAGRTRLLFVDDNSDNAWNMFEYFANRPEYTIFSWWFTPPASGKSEDCQEILCENIRTLDKYYKQTF